MRRSVRRSSRRVSRNTRRSTRRSARRSTRRRSARRTARRSARRSTRRRSTKRRSNRRSTKRRSTRRRRSRRHHMKGGLEEGGDDNPVARDDPPAGETDVSKGLSEKNKNKLKTAGNRVGVPALAAASVALSFGFQKHRGLAGFGPGSSAAVAPGIVGGALLPVLVGAVIMYRKRKDIKAAIPFKKAIEATVNGDPNTPLLVNVAINGLTPDDTEEAVVEGLQEGEKAEKAKEGGRSWNPFRDMKFKKPSFRRKSSTVETASVVSSEGGDIYAGSETVE